MKTSLKKYTSHFIWKGCVCERELETEQRLQHIDLPSPSEHHQVSFLFSWVAQPGAWGPGLSGTCSHSSIFSPTGLQTQPGVPKAPSARWWLSLPYLVSNSSDLQFYRGSRGPLLLGGGFPYHIFSPTHLISNSLTSCLHWFI